MWCSVQCLASSYILDFVQIVRYHHWKIWTNTIPKWHLQQVMELTLKIWRHRIHFTHYRPALWGAPPYMIIRPSLKGGLYMSARKISKFTIKLTCIHVQIFTTPHEHYDKSAFNSFASFHKSIWIFWQIWMTLVTNTHKDYSKSKGISWKILMTLLTNKHEDVSKVVTFP